MSTTRESAESSDTREGFSIKRSLVPSLGDVVFMVIFYFGVLLGANLTNRDGDLGRHLRLGRSMLDDARIPSVDVYSHTLAGGEMVPHEWLAQTALAATERWFGFDGIGILVALLAAVPWFLMYAWLVRRGTPISLSAGLVVLGASASAIHWAARPHAFTWLFVLAWVLMLEDYRSGRRNHVWWLVPLTVLWANTHGAFIIGFLLVGTYLVGSQLEVWRNAEIPVWSPRTRHLSFILVLTVVASLANPAGFETILNGFAYVGEDFLVNFTREYNSPDFHNLLFWPFLVMLLLTVAVPGRWTPTTLLLTMSWTVFALYSFRNIPLYALVITPILANSLSAQWPLWTLRSGPLSKRLGEYSTLERATTGGALSLLFVGLMAYTMAGTSGSQYDFSSEVFPVEAVAQIGDDPPGERVFNEFIWGGYLEYCCHPEVRVFIDGQTDYYGTELTMEYDQAINAMPAWRDVFAKHRVDWVLIAPESALAQVLVETTDWMELYRDDTAVVFGPANESS